jgi:hypothetical protein
MPVEGYFFPAGNNTTLAAASAAQYPTVLPPLGTNAVSMYSGSTSANGASTHSTMSYYVSPMLVQAPLQASAVGVVEFFNTSAAGTGSATLRQYLGLYAQSSDSLTLVSSWMGGMLLSQNSATAVTMSVVTGSASGSVASFGGNSSAQLTGTKVAPIAQGAKSTIYPQQLFVVMGMHELSAGIQPLSVSVVVPNATLLSLGQSTGSTQIYQALNGAFSSTSSTNAANSNQWLMPPAVATSAVTATRAADEIAPTVILRGV